MKVHLRIFAIVLTLVMAVSFAGCGKEGTSSNPADSPDKEEPGVSTAVSEEYFEWDGDLISALTESGMKQTEIVIPKRCTGFNGAVFAADECQVKSVTFESDADFDLNRGLSCSHSLERVELPSGLTKISDMEFWRCDANHHSCRCD